MSWLPELIHLPRLDDFAHERRLDLLCTKKALQVITPSLHKKGSDSPRFRKWSGNLRADCYLHQRSWVVLCANVLIMFHLY